MTKLNITDMETLPEEISAKMTSIEVNSDLWAVEDKILKTSLSVKSLLLAAGNLNVSATPDIDADGKPVFPPRDSGRSYHTPQSWRDKGLLNPGTDGYPSITGEGLYYDQRIWETAREISQIPGRLIPDMINKIWSEIEKEVDMTNYKPKGDHPFSRLEAVQRMYIDAQNMRFMNKDGSKKRLLEESETLSRALEESSAQKDRMTHLIDAVEKGYDKPKGSEEGDAMRTFVRLQLSNEHRKDFVNQGVRTAITTALNQLSQDDERQIGCLTIDRVFSLLEWTWRRVMVDSVGRSKKSEDREDGGDRSHKALVACAAQIVAEGAAKKVKPVEELDRAQALAETAQLRKDYADLKNMLVQLQKRAEEVQNEKNQPYRTPYNPGPRQTTRRRGAPRGAARGGWNKDTRKINYRGGREGDNARENDGDEKAFRVNVGKREFARQARVRVLGEIQMKEATPSEESREDKLAEKPVESKVMTRSMAKGRDLPNIEKEGKKLDSSSEEVTLGLDLLKERTEKKAKVTQAWEQGMTDEEWTKWAWGTGSAGTPPKSNTRPGGGTSRTLLQDSAGEKHLCETWGSRPGWKTHRKTSSY